MLYAQAAGSSTGSSSQQSSRGKFYNDKMIVCMANGMTFEQLADGLNKQGFWKSVSGFQKVDFNRRYALIVDDVSVRNKLVESGLNMDGRHIMFHIIEEEFTPEFLFRNYQLALANWI